jgi:NAD(P) transhydrogenase subunit alpha
MYARNVASFLLHVTREGNLALDLADEIMRGTCVTHEGKVVHQAVAAAL